MSRFTIHGEARLYEMVPTKNGIVSRMCYKTPNHITDYGMDIITALLSGCWANPAIGASSYANADMQELAVQQMRITDFASPTAPTDGDTALEGTPIWTADIDPTQAPSYDDLLVIVQPPGVHGQISFVTTIPITDLNGTVITEHGIFSNSDLLIARATYSKEKKSTFALGVEHRFTFARV